MPDETITTETATVRPASRWVDGANGLLPWPGWKVIALIGLPLIVLLCAVVLAVVVPRIEDDLTKEVAADLDRANVDRSGLDIEFNYRNGTITGLVPPGVSADDIDTVVDFSGIRNLDVTVGTSATNTEPGPASTTTTTAAPAEELGSTLVEVEADLDSITLRGEVLTEAQHDRLLEAALTAVDDDSTRVNDELEVTGLSEQVAGADNRIRELATVIEKLAGSEVTGELTDTTMSFTGATVSDDTAAIITDLVLGARSVDGSARIVTDQPDEPEAPAIEAEIDNLQAEFDALSAEIRETVVFTTGSDVLSAGALTTLDKVVALMTTYTQPVVDIEGHTDDQGDANNNADLSGRRAIAVLNYLVAQGVDDARLRATGVGEARPVADNATSVGRAENRRVELVALPTF